jgi:hypothetical protein
MCHWAPRGKQTSKRDSEPLTAAPAPCLRSKVTSRYYAKVRQMTSATAVVRGSSRIAVTTLQAYGLSTRGQARPARFSTDIPARLDRLPLSRFHVLVLVALGVNEVTIVGAIGPGW